MPKILFLFIFSVLASFSHSFADPVKIGLSLPLTGPAATYGIDIKNILLFLRDRENRKDLEFLIEDDACDPKQAVSIARRFTNIEHVKAVLGHPCSGTVMAAAPIYEKAETVLISTGAGAPSVTNAGDYIFRSKPSDGIAAVLLVDYISLHHRKIALVAEETEVAQSIADAFVQEAGKTKLEIVREGFLSGTSDYSTLLLRLTSRGIEGFVFLTQAERGLIGLVKAISDLRIPLPLYGAVFPDSPAFLSAVDGKAEGMIFAGLEGREGFSPEGKKLLQEFESKHGSLTTSDTVFPITYSAFRSLADSLEQPDLKAALYAGKFHGWFGDFRYDANGDYEGMKPMLKRIEKGRPVSFFKRHDDGV